MTEPEALFRADRPRGLSWEESRDHSRMSGDQAGGSVVPSE